MKNGEFLERKLELRNNVFEFLYKFRDSNISGNILRNEFNLTTIQLQELIHDLRVLEEPIICKGNLGYSYTKNKDEILTYIVQLNNRIKSMESALKGLKTALKTRELIIN